MAGRNSSERLVNYMTELRKHLLACYNCKGAMSARDGARMCTTGSILTTSAAREFNSVIEMRRHAISDGKIYACPDLSKHGIAYQMTAMLFTVEGVQGELF
jgi:hypothetical protein